ncbi:hypothetical protein B0H11DRAFT_1325948 [Mycena galericulata]|nr:hypothetical protein B0H11DRAFT_1325948 [Mycena galericulata]
MAARLKANRDRRAQMSASNRAHSKMPMLNEDSTILHADEATEREEPDSRVPSKRERSLDFYDPDSPTISEASYSDGPDEPPRKRGRLDEDAVREALVTTIGYMGHSDDPGDSAPFVIYSGDDRPQCVLFRTAILPDHFKPSRSMSSLSHHDMSALKVKLMEGGRVGSIHDPTEAATWIEKNWEKEPLASFRKRGYDGPFAQMLFLGKPALALFGSKTDEFLRESAKLLSNVSTFPVIIWPSSDKPKSVLACPEIGAEGPVGGFSYDDQPGDRKSRCVIGFH